MAGTRAPVSFPLAFPDQPVISPSEITDETWAEFKRIYDAIWAIAGQIGGGGGGGVTTATSPLQVVGVDVSVIGLTGFGTPGQAIITDAAGTAAEWGSPILKWWAEDQINTAGGVYQSIWTGINSPGGAGDAIDTVLEGQYGGGSPTFQLNRTDGSAQNGNIRGPFAFDGMRSRSANTQVAGGATSVLVGGQFNTVDSGASYGGCFGGNGQHITGIGGVTLGGSNSTVANHSAAAGINHSVGQYCFVGGEGHTVTDHSAAVGSGNTSNSYSFAFGNLTTASNFFSLAGNYLTTADAFYSVALGHRSWTHGMEGSFAFSSTYVANPGDRQGRRAILICETSGAVTTRATVTGAGASATNQFNALGATMGAGVFGWMTVWEPATNLSGGCRVEFTAINNAGTIGITGQTPGAFVGSAALAAATWAAVADNVNGCYGIGGVGIAGKDLKFHFDLMEENIR